jgi:hypothetical protein
MKLLTEKEFETLANIREDYCVSIYIPTHRAGEEVTSGKDSLLLKNKLQKVKHTMMELGMTEAQAKEYLQPAQRLHDENTFWHHQLDGLAIFLSKNHFSYHRLPVRLEEFSCVTNSFHLQQLVPLMSGDGIYYILALSLEKVRLLEATHFYVNELDVTDRIQQGMKEVEKYYEFERSTENQGGLVPNPQNRNGQGEPRPTKKELVEEYFRNVVVGLRKIVATDRTPIVMAGVDYLHPIFKEVAHGLNVMEKGIMGNPDGIKPKELHSKSWDLVEPYFNKEKERTREAYGDWTGTGRTTYDVKSIVPAAFNGRVDTLFVGKGKHQWGRFMEDSQEVELHDEFKYGDDDLVTRAAVQTILNGGNAYVVPESELPGSQVQSKMTAMLRY